MRGDLTRQHVDVVVNAAQRRLLGGGGVDGAIHAAAGPGLLAACKELRRTTFPDGLGVGEAVATPGFELPARWVVHTVGPNWHRGQRDVADLRRCFTNSLACAAGLGATGIAFPAVSAGAYGWDVDLVAATAVDAVATAADAGHLDLVRFVTFSKGCEAAFSAALARGPG